MGKLKFTKKPLGELLRDAGLITQSNLKRAIEEQRSSGKRMGEVLVRLNFVTEFDIASSLAEQLGIDSVCLETATIEPDAIALVPEEIAIKSVCIPISVSKRQLSLAMADPLDYECLKDVGFRSSIEIVPMISTRGEILSAIKLHYNTEKSLEDILTITKNKQEGVVEIFKSRSEAQMTPAEDLKKKSQMAPIIQLFNQIFVNAMKARASDIHIDAQRFGVSVRFRVDGMLQGKMKLPKWVQGALVSRIKVLASLDISERRLPQDGAIRVKLDNRDIDLRVSTLPTQYGEKVVLRILDQSTAPADMKSMGLSAKDLINTEAFCRKHQGILLVTGPTGSGKTSTLYALINQIRSETINIMTVEDPIEYEMEGLNQIQVKPEIGLTFSSTLRSILRQDPNVVMLGEIRDLETAQIAFRAAMTGHLVISTLHTNSATATVTRLLDMGIPRYLISASVIGIISQRLVRSICSRCKVETTQPKKGKEVFPGQFAIKKTKSYIGKGCFMCNQSGFYGRTGIFEILPFSPTIKNIISSGGSEEDLHQAAEQEGVNTMGDDGLKKVAAGITTHEEVLRVIEVDKEVEALCPQCQQAVQVDFIVCPHCRTDLKSRCISCKKQLQPEWEICPYCRTEVMSITDLSAPPQHVAKSHVG